MNPRRHRAILFCAICGLLSSCTTVAATKKGAVGFNRVFADARNEVLLLNILRASEGEPQQFSTISTVSGNMRPDMKITGGLDNLFIGAAKVFNPAGEFGFRNPTITIAPLETKEFRQGMTTPIKIAFVDELVRAGWDPKTVFHLVVKSIQCGDEEENVNFETDLVKSPSWAESKPVRPILETTPRVEKTNAEPVKSVAVTGPEAVKMMREGAGDGIELKIVKSHLDDPANSVRVEFGEPEQPTFFLDPQSHICGSVTELPTRNLTLRSPAGMIQHLGELVPEGKGNDFFRVEHKARIPHGVLVGTRFHNSLWYVPTVGGSRKTLALLAEIIGFQITDASLNASKPTLTVSQE